MYCNHCGNHLRDTDRFCTHCGAAQGRWLPPTKQQSNPPRETQGAPAWMYNYTQPQQVSSAPQSDKREKRREGEIGRNLFAVLASLLILIGVGLFIATIYESIPLAVKVLAIYGLGFAMLGVGLGLYRRNKNYFWLGIASCGLAELLICIIESYSYFVIITLPAAFGLVLIWALASVLLTRIHPAVFKSIGFIGLAISVWLGLSQLTRSDLVPFLCILTCYAAITLLFLVSDRSCVITNTIIAFGSVLNLFRFTVFPFFLPEGLAWISFLTAVVLIAACHALYIWIKLPKNAYPFFAMLSTLMLCVFTLWQDSSLTVPILLGTILVQWIACYAQDMGQGFRVIYTAFAGVFMAVLSFITLIFTRVNNEGFWHWYAIFTAAAYAVYFLTKKQDIAWLAVSVFLYLFAHVAGELSLGCVVAVILAVAIFILTSVRKLQSHSGLSEVWYALAMFVTSTLLAEIAQLIPHDPDASYQLRYVVERALESLLAMVNTVYLTCCLMKYKKLTPKLVVLLIIQGILMISSLSTVSVSFWPCKLIGVITSLLMIFPSVHYVCITKAENKGLLVWQFVKFTLYCMYITAALNCPDIVGNILILVVSVAAVLIGLRMDQKAIRTYGLVLALVDVIWLVFYNIDYSSSLHLSLGIMCCGVLCFGISFIYSRLARASVDKNDDEQVPAEDIEQ